MTKGSARKSRSASNVSTTEPDMYDADTKEAFRKIIYKQNMWRVYKHTGTGNDYDAYKDAPNAATNEVRVAQHRID